MVSPYMPCSKRSDARLAHMNQTGELFGIASYGVEPAVQVQSTAKYVVSLFVLFESPIFRHVRNANRVFPLTERVLAHIVVPAELGYGSKR